MTRRRTWKSVRTDESGAIAVEFALVTPVFLILMIGTLVWGQYFWVAHTVQQLANDSARAALAGLDATERESLARSAVTAEIVDYGALRPEAAVVTVENLTDRLTVSVPDLGAMSRVGPEAPSRSAPSSLGCPRHR